MAEKLIMERSGHLSVNGVHPYECTSLTQQKAVCDTISSVPLMDAKMGNKGKGLPKVYQDDANTVESDVNDTDAKDIVNEHQYMNGAIVEYEDKKDESRGKRASGTKEEAIDIMRGLQFSNLTGCTINFSVR